MSTLKIEHLSKKFKCNDFYSLEDVNLELKDGDIVGLVGKNGAGKSTLLKLVAKSYIPTSGTVKLDGYDIYKANYILRDVGIMIEPVFYSQLTVENNLKFYLDIHNHWKYIDNIHKTLELVDLWEKRRCKPETFSFGMKQRLALAIALVDEPKFLLLDEPFVGLDPYGVQELLNILKTWANKRNISMIISSHQLSELESICNRFVILENGKLKNISAKDKISIYFNGGKNN